MMEKKYKCDFCGKCFNNKNKLMVHIRIHTKEKPYVCTTCGKGFTQKSQLIIHTRIHTNDKPYACKFCDKKFTQKGHVKDHISTNHNKEKPFVCELCKRAFPVKSRLNFHLRSSHCPEKTKKRTREKTYICDKCGRTFSQKNCLVAHLKSHKKTIRHECGVCKSVLPTKGDLIIHMGIHINPGNQLQKLHKKDEQHSNEVLNENLDKERDIEENHNIGEKCKVDVQNSDHVNNEKEVNTEADSELFVGENDEIYQEIDVKEHVVEEQTDNEVRDRTTSAKIDLEKNMPVIAPENSLTCEVCSKCFSHRSSLSRHKKTHMKEKPFQCETCSESFSEKRRLDKHMIRHRPDKRFVCDVCSKGFRWKAVLQRHMRIHTQERPYKCLVCYKTYSDKDNLIRHMRVHTGEKPYVCQVCSRAFSMNKSLLDHMKTHFKKSFPRYNDALIHTKIHTLEINLTENLHANTTQSFGEAVCADVTDEKDMEQDEDVTKVCEEQEPLLESSVEVVEKICDENVGKGHLASHISSVYNKEKMFVCELCGKTFTLKRNLNMHLRDIHCLKKTEKHTRPKIHTCDLCGRTFSKKSYFMAHLKSHKSNLKYGSQVCKMPFPSKEDLIIHKGIHINPGNQLYKVHPEDEQHSNEVLNGNLDSKRDIEENPNIQEKCKVDVQNSDHVNNEKEVNVEVGSELFAVGKDEFYQEIDVKEHVVEEQTDNGVSGTKICTKIDMEKNKQIIASENSHTQKICMASYPNYANLLRHRKIDTPESNLTENLYPNTTQNFCEAVCADITYERNIEQDEDVTKSYEEQERIHESSVEKVEVICDESVEVVEVVRQCNEGEEDRDIVKPVEIFSGVQKADVDCKNKKTVLVPFHPENTEVAHETKEKIDISEPFWAEEDQGAEPIFSEREKLILEKEISGKTSRSETNLEAQLELCQRLSNSKTPLACHVCSRKFDYKSGLASHMQVHTKEKPFSCNNCAKAFSWKTSLVRHMKVHTKENCNFCNRTFSSKDRLGEHIKTHTEIKFFTCEICNQSFLQRVQLEEHKKMHAVIPVNQVPYLLIELPFIVINQ